MLKHVVVSVVNQKLLYVPTVRLLLTTTVRCYTIRADETESTGPAYTCL